MKQSKELIKSLFCGIFFCFFLSDNLWAETSLVIDATSSTGTWEKGIITDRKVLFTDKSYVVSNIQMDVPKPGEYQLFVYAHHNWRKSSPCIYVEAVDSEAKVHTGYHKIENIWYLEQQDKGRWFFISLAQNPYWNLPKGKLDMKFWLEGRSTAWDNAAGSVEDKVSIEYFFLIPVVRSEFGTFLPGIINLESGKGDWDTHYYHPRYATNLIETNRKNSTFSCEVNIPVSAYYQGWLSILSPADNKLEVSIGNKFKKHKINVELNSKNEWSLVPIEPLYLNKESYSIVFENLGSNKIMIDFFMLLPILEDNNRLTNRCFFNFDKK